MFELMIETNFSAAHQLRGYKGECEKLHGHNWKVHVHVVAERLNEIDIAIDFHEIKRLADEVVAPLDHVFLNEIFPLPRRTRHRKISQNGFMTLSKRKSMATMRVFPP